MANGRKSSEGIREEPEPNMDEAKTLPPPENFTPQPPEPQQTPMPQPRQVTEDLVQLKGDGISADEQGNKLALALFAGTPTTNTNGSWEAFPSNIEPEVTSAWQTAAAESGKADWELPLVESASNLSKQKAAYAGGFDPLLLNGIYDQGAIRQHVSTTQLSGGSASSVTLPGPGKGTTPALALPALMEQSKHWGMKTHLQHLFLCRLHRMCRWQKLRGSSSYWCRNSSSGSSMEEMGCRLAKISGGFGYYGPNPQSMMPYGMAQVSGMGQPGGYYYSHY